jgi:hypothetical protein
VGCITRAIATGAREAAERPYFRAPARRLPTFAPPDFDTIEVSPGMALLTMSGLSPIFVKAVVAEARPLAEPPNCDNAPDLMQPLVLRDISWDSG